MERLMRLRSKELVAVGVLGFLVLGAYGVAESDVLASGNPTGDLVAHYRFDEGAGDTVYDATDNDYHADLHHFDFNGTSGWTSGKTGGGLLFDGANDSTRNENIDLSAVGENESFAISGWFKTDSATNQALFGMTRDAFAGDGDSNAYLHVDNNGWLTWLIEPGYRQGGHYIAQTSETFNDGEWHHVYAERERHTWKIYVDGKLRSSEVNESFNEGLRSDANFDMGAYRDRESYLDGIIAEARLWSTNLSDDEITSLYNQGSSVRIGTEPNGTGGKVLDIGFRKQNSTHVFDTSGMENHGTPENGATQKGAVHCKIGRCYDFGAGSNDEAVHVTDDASLDGMDALTMMAWVKSTNSTDSTERIFSKWYSPQAYQLFIDEFDRGSDGQNDQVACEINTTASSVLFDADTTQGTIDGDNTWHHVACRYNGSHAGIYVDGVLQNRQPLTGTVGSSGDKLNIGANGDVNDFDGLIDQAKIFDQALSRQEIIEEAGIDQEGVVLDLRFDAGAGTTVYDHSMHGNNGMIWPNESEAFYWVDGISGTAIKGGGEDYQGEVQVNSPEELELENNFAVSLWFTPGNWSGESYHGTIVRKRGSGSGRPYWLYGARPGEELFFEMRPDNGNYHALFTDKADWKPSKWYHVVAQYYNNQTWEIWVNGEKDVSKTDAIPVSTASGDFDVAYNGFNGSIDEVKVFPYRLSKDRINRLYRRGDVRIGEKTSRERTAQDPGREKLVGRWSFDNGNSTHTFDSSGNVNHGQLNGPTEQNAAECVSGRCFNLDGGADGGDSITVADNPVFDNIFGGFTMAAWVRFDNETTNSREYIVMKSETGGNPWELYRDSDEDVTMHGHEFPFLGKNDVTDKAWHHVVGIINDTHAMLFFDGELAEISAGDYNYTDSSQEMVIGGETAGNIDFLNGSVDDVRIYNRSLSREEVWYLYSSGRDRGGSGAMAGPAAWWRLDSGNGNVTYDAAEENDGETNGRLLDDWEDGDIDGWTLNCGGSPEYEIRDGYRSDNAVWLNSTGGDGLACMYRSDYDAVAGRKIRFWCKGYGCYTCVWNGTDCANSGPGSSDNGRVSDWTLFETTVDQTMTGTDFYFYNDGAVGHAATYDSITEGPVQTGGKTGRARSFDGSDDFVNVSHSPQLDITGSVTMMAWIKRGGSTFSGYDGIVAKDKGTGGTGPQYMLIGEKNTEKIKVQVSDGTNYQTAISEPIPADTWTHVTGVFDSGSKELRMFVDGVKENASSTSFTALQSLNKPVQIGEHGPHYFDGAIDDVRIYPYALNQEQVNEIMQQGSVSIG